VRRVLGQMEATKSKPTPTVSFRIGDHVRVVDGPFSAFTGVVDEVNQDRSFTFVIKTPPAPVLLKRAAGIAKASAVPHKDKIGKVTRAQVREIAQTKLVDLNTDSIEAAMRTIEGTARSMGIEVV